MSRPVERSHLSRAEYWAREQGSGIKHEYCRGEVFAMAGGTPKHAQISGNVYFQVRSRLGGRCRVNNRDQSVYVEETDMATYPDVSVARGPEYHSELTSSLVNPCVIVEVISPSTEAYDRGKKFAHYKRLGSLKEYVLMATDDYAVDHYLRDAAGTWTLTFFTGLEASVRFPSLDVVVPMAEIYADVDPSEIAEESPRPPGVNAPRPAKTPKRP